MKENYKLDFKKNITKKDIEEIMKKGNHTKQKIIIAFIISITIAFISVIAARTKIWDRIPIFTAIFMFVFLHGIFPLNKMYEFIYKKRYLIALIIFIYTLIMGYSGSSIGIYQNSIQTKDKNIYYTPILGQVRAIRGDEYAIVTPISISQSVGENPYSYYSDKLRGTDTDVLSILGAPVLDITLLGKPFNIGYILLGPERGLSFVWYGKLIALILVCFEFFMLITNKKKLISLFGMILVVFSAATQWWYMTIIDVMLWGMLALILIDKFMCTQKSKIKILCSLGIMISAISYIFIFYPAWQIPFAYIYLVVFIWICCKNRKIYKINWKDIVMVLLVILGVAGILVYYFIMSKDTLITIANTSYPGKRFEIGGGAAGIAFSYVYSFLFPYINMKNPCELSGMISLFPIPIIVSTIYLIRNRKKSEYAFVIPMLLVSIIFSIFTLFKTNELFAKYTLLYMVPASRLAVPLSLTQIILMIYIMAHCKKDDKILGKYSSIIVSIIASVFILSIAINTDTENVMRELISYICGLIVLVSTYLLFTINKNKNKEKLIALLIPIALLTGIIVNPIQKGISVITEKPVAKKIQEIIKEDSENNVWISETYQNYPVASGAKVLNSVHTYPNFEFFKTVLGKEEFEKEENRLLYNKYVHINAIIDSKENKLKSLGFDTILLKLTPEKLKELNVGYVLTIRTLEKFDTQDIKFKQVYNEMNMKIYKLEYEKKLK